MAAEVVAVPSLPKRAWTFYQHVIVEMRKVTWPDRPQVQQLSIGVIGITLFIGAVIWLLDLVFQGLLVRFIPWMLGV